MTKKIIQKKTGRYSDEKGNFIIDDEWDLNPLKRINWLPEKIRNFEAGKLIGAKPFRVIDTEIGKIK